MKDRFVIKCIVIALVLFFQSYAVAISVPILCYHDFHPTKKTSMTINVAKFESQMQWLKDHGYHVIPLKTLAHALLNKSNNVPPKSVVITVDDGWQTVYRYLLPIIKKYHYPVTLFIYPSAISQSKSFLTWDQLHDLEATGLFDVESHTLWHPNFKQEKRRLSADAYQRFVNKQLRESKTILEKKLGKSITLLAWPFGIYDPYLKRMAAEAGYQMAFSIDAKRANFSENPMAEPRYMILQSQSMNKFLSIVS